MGEKEEVPGWSGQFFDVDRFGGPPSEKGPIACMVHVADTRAIQPPPGWQHIDTWETESGDVEIHVYIRSE